MSDAENRRAALKVAEEARKLRRALDNVTRWSTYRRRVITLLLALGIVVGMWVNDQHVETCGPGARQVQRLDDHTSARAALCDVTVPLHPHADRSAWPSPWNAVGLAAYLVVFAAAARFTFGQPPPAVPSLPESAEPSSS